MDAMIQTYMEETEDLLQTAEECIIRLENEYTSADVNELFRIVHTIKGSSQMVGYDDIGNLVHKMEDMLDCTRNGTIEFDQSIVSLCFDGLDTVKKMLQCKKNQDSDGAIGSLADDADKIIEKIKSFIQTHKKKEEKIVAETKGSGIVSSFLSKKPIGRNKYYITFYLEDDAPMVSPVFIMILNTADEMGTLMYSSLGDDYFNGGSKDNDTKILEIIIRSDADITQLYTDFALFYVDKINVVNLSRSEIKMNDHCYNELNNSVDETVLKLFMKLYKLFFKKNSENLNNRMDSLKDLYAEVSEIICKEVSNNEIRSFIKDFKTLCIMMMEIYDNSAKTDDKLNIYVYIQAVKLIERAYKYAKGKFVFISYKSSMLDFIKNLREFIDNLDKDFTMILFINMSDIKILQENDIKDLIEIKKQLEMQDIQIVFITEGFKNKSIINIFDCVKSITEFKVFRSEFDAIFGMLCSENCFHFINK